MAAHSTLWIDPHAPAQYAYTPADGAPQAFSPSEEPWLVNPLRPDQSAHVWGIATTIVLALVTVFVLQRMGFRFVIAAGVK